MQDFKEVMAGKSDADLIEIVTKLRDDYQPGAVTAAEAELKSRNLSAEQIALAGVEIRGKETEKQLKADEPLGTGQKILFLLFFWGVIPWAMAGTFKSKGYIKKYREAWLYMKIGLGIFVGIPVFLYIVIRFMSP